MSKFNTYARRLDEMAKEFFKEYTEAHAKLEKAKMARRLAQGAVEQTRRDADLLEAQGAFDTTMSNWADRGERAFKGLRLELENAIKAASVVDPAQVDGNVLALLDSGICTSADFERLLKNSDGNATMQRLILSHIEKTATSQDIDPAERQAMNALLHDSKGRMGFSVLESYDALSGVFNRCLRNPSMIPHWDDLTADAIEDF